MRFTLLLVIVLGLVAGYWAVSWLFKRGEPGKGAADPSASGAQAQSTTAAAQPLWRWYQVLGVAPSASPDEIRAAYRQLMSQYHPDKVSTLGAELQALAERKSKEIGSAYREGMNASGIRA